MDFETWMVLVDHEFEQYFGFPTDHMMDFDYYNAWDSDVTYDAVVDLYLEEWPELTQYFEEYK